MVGECEGEGRNGGESLSLPLTNKIKKGGVGECSSSKRDYL